MRVCAEPVELTYDVDVSTVIDVEIRGTKWYRIFDPKGMKFLQVNIQGVMRHIVRYSTSYCEVLYVTL